MSTATATTTTNSASAVPLSTTVLLRGASKGDPKASEEIIRRYSTLVLTKVRSFRLQDADTLDAIQMTWLRLAENCHRIRCPEHLGGWLATTATRECLHILHQSKRTVIADQAAWEATTDPSSGPEQHVVDADTARALWNLVEELPPRQRTLLRALFTDHPRPYTEVARTTGIPPGAIGPTRARALAQLRDRLEQRQFITWIPSKLDVCSTDAVADSSGCSRSSRNLCIPRG